MSIEELGDDVAKREPLIERLAAHIEHPATRGDRAYEFAESRRDLRVRLTRVVLGSEAITGGDGYRELQEVVAHFHNAERFKESFRDLRNVRLAGPQVVAETAKVMRRTADDLGWPIGRKLADRVVASLENERLAGERLAIVQEFCAVAKRERITTRAVRRR